MKQTHLVRRLHAGAAILALAGALTACSSTPPEAQPVCDTSAVDEATSVLRSASDANSPALDDVRDRLYATTTTCNQTAEATSDQLSDVVTTLQEPGGGFTWKPTTKKVISTGFAVSPFPEREKIIHTSAQPSEIVPDIQRYLDENATYLEDSNAYLGGWHNAEDGLVYLDISIVTRTAAEARNLAQKYDQIAFFDFQTQESVTVEPSS